MRISAPRVWLLLGLGLLSVPVAATAISYACTGLATVTSSTSAAAPGASVVVSGKGFSPHDAGDAFTEPAKLRFDSQTGDVIATASPSKSSDGGRFQVTITVPALAAGDHVLIVTQNGSDGRPAYGTPARLGFAILAAAAAAAPAAGGQAPAIELPAVSQLLTPTRGKTLSQAILECKQRFKVSKAKTAAGRKSMSRKRAACIRSARAKYA